MTTPSTEKLTEATAPISADQRANLYRQIRVTLGEPARPIMELTDDVLDVQFTLAMEDYWSIIYDWLIGQRWGNLMGQDVNTTDFVLAFTNRSNLDYLNQFTVAYGKQTGIGTMAEWELKKDYIEVISGQQTYEIPAGREVNEVLWHTPPVLGGAATGNPGSLPWLAQANGWLYGNQSAGAILPSYSQLLFAQDQLQRNRINLSEHSYKVTGGPDGSKLIHLYPVPGSNQEIPDRYGRHTDGSLVWYWYYDTNAQGRDKCQEVNSDIIHLPDEVPLQVFNWGKMNLLSRTRVRKLLVRNAARYVALVRGMFSGEMPSPSATAPSIKVDYAFIQAIGDKNEESVMKEIMESLDKITSINVLERLAKEAEAINRTIRFQPIRNGGIVML